MSEGNTSTFNEALFKMKRLDSLQQTCNDMRTIPYHIDKSGPYCFKIHFDALISLYQEIASKLKKKEEREVIRPKLIELKKHVRVLSSKMPRTLYGSNDRTFFNSEEGLKIRIEIEDGLFECEELIRDYLDEHGFGTLNAEDLQGDKYA